MKKHYLKPTTRVVKLRQCKLLNGSPAARSLSNSEGFDWDSDGLEDSDDLR